MILTLERTIEAYYEGQILQNIMLMSDDKIMNNSFFFCFFFLHI